MRWYVPSANGDMRLEPDPKNKKGSLLKTVDLTDHERFLVGLFLRKAREEKWVAKDYVPAEGSPYQGPGTVEIPLKGLVSKTVPALVEIARPKDRTLNAVVFKDGHIETCDGAKGASLKELTKLAKKAEDEKAKAGASVKRPTPCCPSCEPGSIEPAREVLLDFLTPEQHEDWAEHRALVAEGGTTGNRYLIAHRHSEAATRMGKVAMDVDTGVVLHFHDWNVPPEEEVLAAKLILEHREAWLRNQATYFTPNAADRASRLRNPFGTGGDGVIDSAVTRNFGDIMQGKRLPENHDLQNLGRILGIDRLRL